MAADCTAFDLVFGIPMLFRRTFFRAYTVWFLNVFLEQIKVGNLSIAVFWNENYIIPTLLPGTRSNISMYWWFD